MSLPFLSLFFVAELSSLTVFFEVFSLLSVTSLFVLTPFGCSSFSFAETEDFSVFAFSLLDTPSLTLAARTSSSACLAEDFALGLSSVDFLSVLLAVFPLVFASGGATTFSVLTFLADLTLFSAVALLSVALDFEAVCFSTDLFPVFDFCCSALAG